MTTNLHELTKAVVAWSGGLDSTALIPLLVEEYHADVYPIFVNRFQENYAKEDASVSSLSTMLKQRYGTKFHDPFRVAVPIPAREFKQAFPSAQVEKTHALRNSDIVNQAVRYALLIDAEAVSVGSNVRDTFGDSSSNYWRRKDEEVRAGLKGSGIRVIAVYHDLKMDKRDIVKWCALHDIPIHKSWSCWYDYDLHCGKCPPCTRRKEAFALAQVADETSYLAS